MSVLRAVVWTVVRGPPESLWTRVSAPSTVGGLLGAGDLAAVDGLAEALAHARPGTHSVPTRWGPTALTVQGGRPGLRVVLTAPVPGLGLVTLRRRLERTLGDGTRWVDELLATPVIGVFEVARWAVLRALTAGQRKATEGMEVLRPTTSRAWSLVPGNLGHADPMLAALDGPAPLVSEP